MRTRVERLVEDYNEVREALARTRVEQARTRRQGWRPAPPARRPPPARGPYSGARVRISSIGRRDHIGAIRPTG
jgi:hypothetical protein